MQEEEIQPSVSTVDESIVELIDKAKNVLVMIRKLPESERGRLVNLTFLIIELMVY